MPSAAEVARQHQQSEARLAASVLAAITSLWRRVTIADLDGTWGAVSGQASTVLAAGQLAAAQVAEGYIEAALLAQGIDASKAASLVPRAFVGATSTGRSIPDTLISGVIRSKEALLVGASPEQALRAGEASLQRIATTEVADAGRSAGGTSIVTRRSVTGYVRQVSAGACSRCMILAGKFYRWNAGFQRHPHCTCVHIPTTENVEGDVSTDPDAAFRAMSSQEQDRTFGKAGAQAIRDGADMGQVVNARSGMTTAADGWKTTTVNARQGTRLMPETIYSQAGSRAEALDLLRQYGYIA
jgi:hypothetical protein